IDDLFSAASIGLIESMDRFDKSRNVSFNTFAERRIKGAILDSLRNLDFLPRNVRSRLKSLEKAVNELSRKLGRKPSVQEIIDNTDYDEEDVYRLMGLQENEKMLSLDETVGDGEESSLVDFIRSSGLTPEDEVMKASLTERMGEEIDKLSNKERQVIALYYYEELTMKEVAEALDITESRVSQIHTSAMQKLKRRLKDIYE
ncbi:MAG: FliA/WhiG family RNA polymerase sigma factor, partial [Mucispirillum sp.]|nr:FliA/WhiG family RNA polymerase sigma factor [Mucispirillum sp.]